MINPISVATNGYITPFQKKALEISVDGYLIFGVPPPPIIEGGLGKWQPTKQIDWRRKYLKEQIEIQNREIIVSVIKRFLDAVD